MQKISQTDHQLSGSDDFEEGSVVDTCGFALDGAAAAAGGGGGEFSSPPVVMEHEKRIRREIANSNERRRMQSINAGFQTLRDLLPHDEGEKLSKAAILQQTSEFIYSLEQEKTRLLTQNCQLKRLLAQQQQGGDSDSSAVATAAVPPGSPLLRRSASQDSGSDSTSSRTITTTTNNSSSSSRVRSVTRPASGGSGDGVSDVEEVAVPQPEVASHTGDGGESDQCLAGPAQARLPQCVDSVLSVTTASTSGCSSYSPSPSSSAAVGSATTSLTSAEDELAELRLALQHERQLRLQLEQQLLCDHPTPLAAATSSSSAATASCCSRPAKRPRFDTAASSPPPLATAAADGVSALPDSSAVTAATVPHPEPTAASVSELVFDNASTGLYVTTTTSRQNLHTIVEAIRHVEGEHLFQDSLQEAPVPLRPLAASCDLQLTPLTAPLPLADPDRPPAGVATLTGDDEVSCGLMSQHHSALSPPGAPSSAAAAAIDSSDGRAVHRELLLEQRLRLPYLQQLPVERGVLVLETLAPHEHHHLQQQQQEEVELSEQSLSEQLQEAPLALTTHCRRQHMLCSPSPTPPPHSVPPAQQAPHQMAHCHSLPHLHYQHPYLHLLCASAGPPAPPAESATSSSTLSTPLDQLSSSS